MEKTDRNFTTLQKRVITSLIMIPLVIGALRFGHPYVEVLVYLVGVMLSWEWATMMPNRNSNLYSLCYAFALGCSIFTQDRNVLFFIFLCVTLFVYLRADGENNRYLITLGVPYIAIGVGSLDWMYHSFNVFGGISGEKGCYIMTLWFILMVWSVDIGGYIIGTTLKGPKLAPSISPNKTWSGLIGGVILAVAVTFIYMYAIRKIYGLPLPLREQLKFAQSGAIIAFIAQIGDLIESAIKRHLKIKDSSSLIPGHGGVFDRIDGLIFAAPIVYGYCLIMDKIC